MQAATSRSMAHPRALVHGQSLEVMKYQAINGIAFKGMEARLQDEC
jgi:hypothetical protein